MTDWQLDQLKPFGLVVTSKQPGSDLYALPTANLQQWVENQRVVILRGFAPLEARRFPQFCSRFGEILEWDFGAVNELRVQSEARNYLYTNREVPFHWDGAFAGRVPRYIFFHCDEAPPPGSGGETLFCDTVRLLEEAPPERRALWAQIDITYTTQKIVHYGGSFTSPMICSHLLNGNQVLRFAEPVVDLNPVQLEINGIPEEEQAAFLKDMHERLHNDAVCYRHEWRQGDVVIADNFVLLHGRDAFADNSPRKIRRVNIL